MSFIKIDRKLLKWEWKDDPYMVALWIEILLQANWEDRRWHGKDYEAGSFPTSVAKLAKATGMSVKRVRTCLQRLEKSQEVAIETANDGTKIIVNKWADYQGFDDDKGKQNGKRWANGGQTVGNTIRNKEKKEGKNIYNSLPIYDPSKNEEIGEELENELLELMKGQA